MAHMKLTKAQLSAMNRASASSETPTVSAEDAEWLASSDLERMFMGLWRRHGGPDYVRDFQFDRPRSGLELDFAWPDLKVAVEINGGQGAKGNSGHGNWYGLERDAEKQNLCVLRGWTLFWLPTSLVRDEWVSVIADYIKGKAGMDGGGGRGNDGLLVLVDGTGRRPAGEDNLPARPVRRRRRRPRKSAAG